MKALIVCIVILLLGAVPVRADSDHRAPFPPPPPRLTGDCKEDAHEGAGCLLVCHTTEGHQRWMWIEPEHLARWLKEHEDDYVYGARIDEFVCAYYHGWFMAVNGANFSFGAMDQ